MKLKDNDKMINTPRKKISIATLALFDMRPITQKIPRGYYPIDDFIEQTGLGIRALNRRFNKLKEEDKIDIIKIIEKNKNNRNIVKTYYRIKK